MSPPDVPSPADALPEDDVHCLRCGYNLRGLAGDPIRCPECGHRNVVADLGRDPELDWRPWWVTPDGAELMRKATVERQRRTPH